MIFAEINAGSQILESDLFAEMHTDIVSNCWFQPAIHAGNCRDISGSGQEKTERFVDHGREHDSIFRQIATQVENGTGDTVPHLFGTFKPKDGRGIQSD